jgi:hypothetical protein
MDNLMFKNKSFCFTGKLAELKRTQAEREARARGGVIISIVNEQLDYLIVGSIPSPGWKHGDFGTKIQKAKELFHINGNRPILIPESEFMESLAESPIENSGEIEDKVVVCKYRFYAGENSYGQKAFEDWIEILNSTHQCHVAVFKEDLDSFKKLFVLPHHPGFEDSKYMIKCRIVKKIKMDESAQVFADVISKGFEGISGIDGTLDWYERTEGTSAFMRLLKEIPSYNSNKQTK